MSFNRRTFLKQSLTATAGVWLTPSWLVAAEEAPHPIGPFPRDQLPTPILPAEPGLTALYWKAWELAWDHIIASPGAPQTPYLDEAANLHRIWIWDTCFMSLFCRYGAKVFPGIESLNNFYAPMHDGFDSPLTIRHWDNPPLFAWIELEHFRHTGDTARLHWLLEEKQYLQKHYDYFERTPELTPPGVDVVARREGPGYRWSGNPSGMDNTPRGKGDYGSILWIDAIGQQALSARCIAELASVIGREDIKADFTARFEAQQETINRNYWDRADGFYYDIGVDAPHAFCKVRTPASYWPMLAGVCDAEQAAALHERALDPQWFGGPIPWPTVDRASPEFSPTGYYWRGGVWLPTAYMGIKALERYGYADTARTMSLNLIRQMEATYREYSPATIWECYSPTANLPSTKKDNKRVVRRDFCGWSALGPISLLIENVLGFESIDAISRTIRWRKSRDDVHGIRGLVFGDITTDILSTGTKVTVESNASYTLGVNDTNFAVRPGMNTFEVS